jgi:hypothetical protein
MVRMAGVLVLAAGVPTAGDHSDYRTVTLGYFVMRTVAPVTKALTVWS